MTGVTFDPMEIGVEGRDCVVFSCMEIGGITGVCVFACMAIGGMTGFCVRETIAEVAAGGVEGRDCVFVCVPIGGMTGGACAPFGLAIAFCCLCSRLFLLSVEISNFGTSALLLRADPNDHVKKEIRKEKKKRMEKK